jgi:tetratricopeptide (TPR) repeat protein
MHLNKGEYALARDQLCSALTMPEAEDAMRVWAALASHACGDDAAARILLRDWPQWTGLSEEAMLELGWLLSQLGELEAGDSILSREFQDSTIRMRALARRVFAYERLNRLDEAAALVTRMGDPSRIADPQSRMESLHAMARMAFRTRDHARSRQCYEAALALDVPPRYRQSLCFGLARVCDLMGDVESTMAALRQAHAEDLTRYTEDESSRVAGTGLLSLLDPGCRIAAPTSINDDGPTERDSPVFVVGFPRSGTTLLEQMLTAHPGFASTDEQPMVQRMLATMRELGLSYPGDLGELSADQRSALREVYWREVARTVEHVPGMRLVDKHPLNFLALPLIRTIFPNAPMIFCVRHPCDSMLSCHMQSFRDPRLATECSSLERLADLYARLTECWQHDSALYPTRIHVSRHEDLVADAQQHLKKIGAFLGVEDTAPMLNFRERAQARGFIGTPSYAQVVQGLNAEAVGRWERYREHLAPLLPRLAPIMEYWGYTN